MATDKLLDAVNTDTVGNGFNCDGNSRVITLFYDDIGGGTVTLEISDDGGIHWVPVTFQASPVAWTTATSAFIEKLSAGQLIRASLTGATSPSNVSVYLTS